MKPRACILRADGTNCDEETAYAFGKAGADARKVHINELRGKSVSLRDYQILAIPGGFSYGDDVASGKILAVELLTFLRDELEEFVSHAKLVIGICNGFQVLVRTGLLPFRELGKMNATLSLNNFGRFDCRWVRLYVEESPCIFAEELVGREISLMVAHGEGKFYAPADTLERIEKEKLVTLRYGTYEGPAMTYPENPNGSQNAIAGICDSTGRICGLMPHPERYVELAQHPNWRRGSPKVPQGLPFFQSAVLYAKYL